MKLFWFEKRVNLTSDCSQLMAEVVSNIPAQRMQYFLYCAWVCMICSFVQTMLQPHMVCLLKIYWKKIYLPELPTRD